MPEGSDGHRPGTGERPGAGDGRQQHGRHGNRNQPPEKFTGKSDDLRGFIYDVATTNAKDSFQKTTSAIADYVARTCDHGGEYRLGLVELALPDITEPTDPAANANILWLHHTS